MAEEADVLQSSAEVQPPAPLARGQRSLNRPSPANAEDRVMTLVPLHAPGGLFRELASETPKDSSVFGCILDLGPVLSQYQRQRDTLAVRRMADKIGPAPMLIVPPEEMPWIFKYERELDLAKTIAATIAGQFHSHGKTVINGIWLVYGAAKLYRDWNQFDRDTFSCCLKLVGLGLGTMQLAGDISPDLKLSDHWNNDINFVLKSSETLYAGRTPSPIEQMSWLDSNLTIPDKIYKTFNALCTSGHPAVKAVTFHSPPPQAR
jgi:hypothetical protein